MLLINASISLLIICNKTKGPKQDILIWLGSPICEGGEPFAKNIKLKSCSQFFLEEENKVSKVNNLSQITGNL